MFRTFGTLSGWTTRSGSRQDFRELPNMSKLSREFRYVSNGSKVVRTDDRLEAYPTLKMQGSLDDFVDVFAQSWMLGDAFQLVLH